MSKGTILYLRTDITDQEMTAGGSVAHTVGVINGFRELGYEVVCGSSCLGIVLEKVGLKELVRLSNPSWLRFLRWKLNSFLSSFFFFFQLKKMVKKYEVICIYQRYSLLNMTGVLLAWCYKKKLILEYNGSEAWIALNWIKKKYFITGTWLMNKIEWINLYYTDSIIVVSEVLKDELVGRGIRPDKILVNPNGVDPSVFNFARSKKEVLL